MDGNTLPPKDHNEPPKTALDELRAKANEFAQAAKNWGDNGVNSQKDAERINDFISGTRTLWRAVDDERKARKKPHDDAGKAVQAAFAPLLKSLTDAGAAAKALLTSYTQKVERELAEQRRREAEEAAKREAEAKAKAAEAEQCGDHVAAAEAETQAAEEAKAVEKATSAAAAKVRITSASGGGRTAGMRTFRTARIANIALALSHYRKHPEIAATVERLANADLRAAKGAEVSIPGIEIVEERRIA